MSWQRELTPEDYISMLRRRWLLIGLLIAAGGVLGIVTAHFLPKRYTSQTLVLVSEPTVPGDYVKPVVGEDTNARLAAMKEQILSRARLEPVIRRLGLYSQEVDHVQMEDLVGQLRKAITVTPIQPMAETQSNGLPGFTVSVNYNDGRLAQEICSTITSLFIGENSQGRQTEAEETTQFLGGQLEDAKEKLDSQDTKLAAFQRRYLGSLPDESQTNLNLLTGLAAQLDATTQELGRAQQDKAFTDSMLTQQLAVWQATPQQQTTAKDERKPENYVAQLAALEQQLDELRARYTDDHPDVIRLKGDIEALKAQMAAVPEPEQTKQGASPEKQTRPVAEPPQILALRAQVHQDEDAIKEMSAREARIQEQIKTYQERLQATPAVAQEYKELTRDYQTALDFYNDLLKKRDQSAMATDLEKQQQGEQFQVLDPANYPENPSFPNKIYFGLGGLGGGLALGLGIALLMELQDTSLHTEKDVESLLHIPVLAMVPALKNGVSKSRSSSLRFALRN